MIKMGIILQNVIYITMIFGVWYIKQKSNISNIYGDIIQTETGFDDIIDIDIEI